MQKTSEDILVKWLFAEAERQIEGCRALAPDGVTWCFKPDGTGHYGAMWTRDFFYMADGFPEAISAEDLRNAVDYLFNHTREDGVAPDRVQCDGLAVYSAGPVDSPTGEPPTDNHSFLIMLIELCAGRLGSPEVFAGRAPRLEMLMNSLPRHENGLIFIAPDGPGRSPYGFTDCVRKTGCELFSSLLYREACLSMSRLYGGAGDQTNAARWRREAERVKSSLTVLWDEQEGVFLAATQDCRQPDVWGSAYAVYTGAAPGEAERIARWLDAHYDEIVWEGMTRHIREPGGWQSMLRHYPVGDYQNGAYWPLPIPWMARTLAIVNPERAKSMVRDLLRHMNRHGINEWENRDGLVGAPNYVASATMAVLAARESGLA